MTIKGPWTRLFQCLDQSDPVRIQPVTKILLSLIFSIFPEIIIMELWSFVELYGKSVTFMCFECLGNDWGNLDWVTYFLSHIWHVSNLPNNNDFSIHVPIYPNVSIWSLVPRKDPQEMILRPSVLVDDLA